MQKISTSKSVRDLRYSVIREMSGMAAGIPDAINLGIGEPDFDTPTSITRKAFEDARNGHTHYTPSQGDPELIERLAAEINASSLYAVEPSAIIVTHGAMGAIAAALRTVLEQGDHVLLMEPHFSDYDAHITLAGGVSINISTKFEEDFLPHPEDIENSITPKTKVIILNSPNNPTGGIIPGELLDSIAKIAIRHNLLVFSDEVYDRILFEPPFESISSRPGMADRTLVFKSFSKSYAMTGWRVGYCYGPQILIDQMQKVVSYFTSCASSIGQRAAIAALDCDPLIVEKMKNRFAARAELVCSSLDSMRGVQVLRPKGSFYIFVDISQITRQSKKFAIDLFNSNRVVVIPGYAFGDSGEGCVRIACTRNESILSEAMDRLDVFINEYQVD